MSRNLYTACERFGLNGDDFPGRLELGGYSDDCAILGISTNYTDGMDMALLGHEYTEKAVRVDLGDGRCIVLTSVYEDRAWITHVALPPGCKVEIAPLDAERWAERQGEDS